MTELPRFYEQFAAHIELETQKARMEAPIFVNNPDVLTVGCDDSLTQKGVWNPPGGGLFLLMENWLFDFFKVRRGSGSGVLAVHLNCWYLRIVHGLSDIKGQLHTITIFQREVIKLNERFQTDFNIIIEGQGSAAPYMNR